jgi:tRNA (guanine26-N2/guanine27-N2)-dimethyltransferase
MEVGHVYLCTRDKADLLGLLAITCTDLAVLAGSQYPEKWFVPIFLSLSTILHCKRCSLTCRADNTSYSNYGGVCVAAEYSHEVALRLVLSSLATTAGRYGRYITPLLSFSIDFYVRLFVRIDTKPELVKSVAR